MSLDRKIDDLRRAYRAIEAGPHFAGRVTARVAAGRKAATSYWLPAAVAAAAVAVAVLTLQIDTRQTEVPAQRQLALSLPAMPGAVRTPQGMRVKLPSLSRTRALPVMPSTPARKKPKPRRESPDSRV